MRHYHKQPSQADLFEPSDIAEPLTMPDWQTLPFQTREAITGLIARLLMEHACEPVMVDGQKVVEVDDD